MSARSTSLPSVAVPSDCEPNSTRIDVSIPNFLVSVRRSSIKDLIRVSMLETLQYLRKDQPDHYNFGEYKKIFGVFW
jgi:hypothetical protein